MPLGSCNFTVNPLGSPPKRGTRITADWKPSADDEQFALGLGFDPQSVAAEFIDYWTGIPGQKGIKLDWSATFKNRCRQKAEFAGKHKAHGTFPQTGGKPSGSFVDAVSEFCAETYRD